MKKLQIFVIATLLLFSICILNSMQAKAQETAVSITVSPDPSTLSAGNAITFTATASDAYGDTWDVTNLVTWSISSGAGGSWNNNVYTSAKAGSWTVTADNGAGINDTASLQVTPGTLAQFIFNPIDSSKTAGTSFSLTITAKDTYGNIVTGYSGTASLSDTSGSITPTIIGDFISGVWTGGVTITHAGSDMITAEGVGGGNGSSGNFIVNAADLDHFVFGNIGTQVSGVPFTITVIAVDVYGNTVTSYTGTPSLMCSAGTITPPSATGGFSDGVWSGMASATVAGSSISLGVDDDNGHTGTSNLFTMRHAVAANVAVSPSSAVITAGNSETYSAVATDAYGNSWDATDSVTWSISSGAGGSWNNNVYTSAKAGSWTVTAAISAVHSTASLLVNTGATTHLEVSSGVSQVAGIAFSVTVTAKDANDNTVTGYIGKINFISSDSGTNVSLPNDYTFLPDDLGTHIFVNGVTLVTAGTQSITVSDTVAGSITGLQTGITVSVASNIHFMVSGFPSSTTAGAAHNVTVTAKDAYNNTVMDYAGTVKITSSDSKAILPSNEGLISGVGSFTVTLKTAGSQAITATDVMTASITGSENGLTVNHAVAVPKIVVSPAGSSVTAGLSTIFSVATSDAYGNTWDVTNLVTWSISSGAGGSWNNNVYTSAKAGSWTVTADNGAGINDTASLQVTPGTLAQFIFNPIDSSKTAGTSFSLTITAKDTYGNIVTGYSGTASLSDTSGSITPTIIGDFISGVWTGGVTITHAGSDMITAEGVGGGNGSSGNFIVNAADLDHFVFGNIGTQVSGVPFTITVIAVDVYGNTVTSYTGTPSLMCSAGTITPNTMSDFSAGVGSTSINVATGSSLVTLLVADLNRVGNSNSFILTIASTPTPTSTIKPTPSSMPKPSPTPTGTPTTAPTSTPTFSTTPTPIATILPAPVPSIISLFTDALPSFTFLDLLMLFALCATILLITSKLESPHYGLTNLIINKKRLRNAFSVLGLLFLLTIGIKAISTLTG